MTGGRDVYITWEGGEVFLRGHSPDEYGLFVSGDGIEGWDSAPDAKVQMTEMQTGDGAHVVTEQEVLYSARTVSVHFHAHGRTRDETVRLMRSLSAACHKIVRLRVVDGADDTYCTGYVQPGFEAKWLREWATGVLTVVCADPRRYSTLARSVQLLPTASSPGGLHYGTGSGLVYDLTYGGSPSTLQNVATLSNEGTSDAFPIITVTGPMDAGLRIDWDEGAVGYSEAVGYVPLELDCLTRTASIAGLDVSRNLLQRSFPRVPAGGSVLLSLQGTGTGWVTVEWHDTYI